MKSSILRPALALALALGLSACGGSESFNVSGTVSKLAYPGLVLTNNGDELPIAVGATTFSFPKTLEYGDAYNVTVKTNPAHQTCEPDTRYNADTAGRLTSINVPIHCATNAYSVGGKISGLTSDGLVLANGTPGGTVKVAKDATVFAFQIPVEYGQSYGVTVLEQPSGQTCSIANGVGVMGDAKVENLEVTCSTSIGG